jgi:hypothetical protein
VEARRFLLPARLRHAENGFDSERSKHPPPRGNRFEKVRGFRDSST